MKNTHTYVVLDVSSSTYREIREKLDAAGYRHAFHDIAGETEGEPRAEVIDLHGIALREDRSASPQDDRELTGPIAIFDAAMTEAARRVRSTGADIDTIEPGLYRVFWKSGGSSLAAVGIRRDGTRWLAPTNWVTPSLESSLESSTSWRGSDRHAWDSVERVETIDAT